VTTSLLTLYAMAKVWNRAFWRPVSAEPDALETVVGDEDSGATVAQHTAKQTIERRRMPLAMVATATVLVLLGVGITVVSGPLYGYAERSATDIVDGASYVRAVLREGIR
jgi:multicomponent Na+:H+ antiporter subunit D